MWNVFLYYLLSWIIVRFSGNRLILFITIIAVVRPNDCYPLTWISL